MFLSDLIEDLVTQKLKELCIGKYVNFYNEDDKETTILCTNVSLVNTSGEYWIKFLDENSNQYYTNGFNIIK